MRNMANGITFFFYGVGDISFFLVNIGITNYKTLYLILMVFGVLAFGLNFLIIETPFMVHKQLKIKKLYEGLCTINATNFGSVPEQEAQNRTEIRELVFQGKYTEEMIAKSAEMKLHKTEMNAEVGIIGQYRSIPLKTFGRIFLLSIVLINIYIGYGMTLLVPESMGIDNIYLNGVLLGLSELVGYSTVIIFAHKIPRRKLNILNSASLIFFSGVLYSLRAFDIFFSPAVRKVLESIISVVMKLIICMNFTLIFNYCAELVETKIRGFCLGYTVFSGRASSSLCSVLESACRGRNIHPMIASSLPAFFALPISFILPETLNKPIKN